MTLDESFNHTKALAYRIRPASTDAGMLMDSIIVCALVTDEKRRCWNCDGDILVGQTARVRFEIQEAADGKRTRVMTRVCALCCAAMAKAEEDDGRAVKARQSSTRRMAAR